MKSKMRQQQTFGLAVMFAEPQIGQGEQFDGLCLPALKRWDLEAVLPKLRA